jgi:hypothetical protein
MTITYFLLPRRAKQLYFLPPFWTGIDAGTLRPVKGTKCAWSAYELSGPGYIAGRQWFYELGRSFPLPNAGGQPIRQHKIVGGTLVLRCELGHN